MSWCYTRQSIRRRSWAFLALAPACIFAPLASAQDAPPATCTKAEFETVVDQAAAELRNLNAQNKPHFQEKLRQLKDKRGWSQDQFLKEAAPYVKDDEIEVFDTKSNELLGKISSMGEQGSAAKTPDCALLAQLHSFMNDLVQQQTSKWSYMFAKLDQELAK